MVYQAQADEYRMSQAESKSIAPPMQPPWVAAITGFGQSTDAF